MYDYGDVPYNLEMANLGSTFSKYGFDYQYFAKRGFNFAVAPQPLKTDICVGFDGRYEKTWFLGGIEESGRRRNDFKTREGTCIWNEYHLPIRMWEWIQGFC